ncbi:MAG TPA: hypothetical protein VHV76_00455 [Mycobacteriales bacterium]|nr:hypothetical protein [Mycobacteriales bacterium]
MIPRPSIVRERGFGRRTISGARDEGAAMDRSFGAFAMGAPWQVADVSRLLFRVALALVAFLVTWYGAAHTTHVNRQLAWLAGGSAAAAIGLVAVVAWETAGLARVRYLKLEVASTIRVRYEGTATAAEIRNAIKTTDPAKAALWVSAPGMRLYHRPGCQLALGKPVKPVNRATIDRAGLAPCGACDA